MTLARRSFLRNLSLGTAGLVAGDRITAYLPRLGGGAVRAAGQKVVVFVSLFGGNDGLNTVVPLAEYDRYRRLRPTIGFDREALVPLPGNPEFALNPGLEPLAGLYGRGQLAIVAGVGVPRTAADLFDHAAQQFEFQSCDVNRNQAGMSTGWLGRYCDAFLGGDVAPGIDLGGGRLPLTGMAADPLSISSIDALSLAVRFDAEALAARYRGVQSAETTSAVGARHREVRLQALDQSAAIRAAVAGYVPGAAYPAGNFLARQLRECARILWGGLGVRALSLGAGGFDTHGEQEAGRSEASLGYHASLLNQVAAALAAFQEDLESHGLADDVVTVVVSEFGRTPYENGSGGCDHGYGSVAFVLGSSVSGGVHGNYPGLSDDRLVFGQQIDVTTDFRSVYATIVAGHLDADPVPVVGGSFPLLPFL